MPFEFTTKMGMSTTIPLSIGEAIYDPLDMVIVEDQAIPRRILLHSGGGENPWLTMGIEIVDGAPECVHLELSRTEHDGTNAACVRDKHLKMFRLETMVGEIVAACAQQVTPTERGYMTTSGPTTAAQRRTVQRMQRRRRDPNDRELLERVAEIYKANPAAPVKAVMDELGMSQRTAGRWAARCTEAGLLPKTDTGRIRK